MDEFVAAFEGHTFTEPEDYLEFFMPLVGSKLPLGNLAPPMRQGALAAMRERSPAEAEIPLDEIRVPVLVISGAHHEAFDAVVDVLVERLGAERAVLPGAGHSLPRAPGFNEVLADWVERHS